MAHTGNKAIYMLNADTAPTFNPGPTGGLAKVIGTTIFYFHITGTSWTRIDVGALSGSDGNDVPIVRGNATTGVAPTAGEIPSPTNGDSANISLTDGKVENWVFTSSAWALAYTLQSDKASNLAIAPTATNATVSNTNGTGFTLAAATSAIAGLMTAADKQKLDFIVVSSTVDINKLEDSIGVSGDADMGTFTGSVITDNTTIKIALQELETALEGISDFIQAIQDTATIDLDVTSNTLVAALRIDPTQDNLHHITFGSGGGVNGVRITAQTLTAFDNFSDAQASGLAVGDAFVLSIDNIEGIPSDGVTGPVFRKQ